MLYRLFQYIVTLSAMLIVSPMAAFAQSQDQQMYLCITQQNTMMLVSANHEDCQHLWGINASFTSVLDVLQQVSDTQGDFKTLLEMLLAQSDEIVSQMLQGKPQNPASQTASPLPGTSMMPAFPFPQQMSGAVAVTTSRNGVGVTVSQQNGNPAVVTIHTNAEQHTFTVDEEE